MNPLQQGSKGAEVAKLQTSLKSAGFDPGLIDSDFGPKTAAALSSYQTSKGLKADSVFGPITSGALYGAGSPTSGRSPYDIASSFDSANPPAPIDAKEAPYNPENGIKPPSSTVVGTSDSARQAEIQRIKDELEAGLDEPAPYKSLDEFTKLRKEQGVVKDEEELASVRNEAAQIQQSLREFSATAGEGTSEAGRIGAVSERERNAQFKLDSLNLRETAVTNRLNTKNSYINTALNLGKEDYNTALTKYTNEYNKNTKAIDLYNAKLNDQQKDALTGFTTLSNLLKDTDMSTLDPSVSSQLDTLALQAGLPKGIFQSVIAATPNEKILAPQVVDTATGKDIYFYTQGKDGTPTLKKVEHLTGSGKDVEFKGFSGDETNAIKKDIKEHGLEKTLAGITDPEQVKAIQDMAKTVETENEKKVFLTKEYLSGLFTEDQLKAAAKEAGFRTTFSGWASEKEKYLTYLENSVTKYREAGYNDQEILKLMK